MTHTETFTATLIAEQKLLTADHGHNVTEHILFAGTKVQLVDGDGVTAEILYRGQRHEIPAWKLEIDEDF